MPKKRMRGGDVAHIAGGCRREGGTRRNKGTARAILLHWEPRGGGSASRTSPLLCASARARARAGKGFEIAKPPRRTYTWSLRSCGSARPFLATATSVFRWSLAAKRSREKRSRGGTRAPLEKLTWHAVLLTRGNFLRVFANHPLARWVASTSWLPVILAR